LRSFRKTEKYIKRYKSMDPKGSYWPFYLAFLGCKHAQFEKGLSYAHNADWY
jgi:hypothetical protein